VQKSNHIDLLTQELSQVKPLSEVAAIVASGASEPPSKKRKTTDDDFVDVKALQAQLETLSQEKADIASAFESYREKATTEINQLQADKKDLAEELAAVKTAFAAKSSALSSDATLKLKQELEETKKQLSVRLSQLRFASDAAALTLGNLYLGFAVSSKKSSK
jgi:chromosome segregation ATPase